MISEEKNNGPNFTLWDIPFSFSASAPLAGNWRRQAKLRIACFLRVSVRDQGSIVRWAGSFLNHKGFMAGPGAHAQECGWFGQLCSSWVSGQREQMGRELLFEHRIL
jgi:hypothetical protein